MALKTAVWRLQSGLDRRFRAGHPWVYSNELQGSPKGIEAGAPVELQDAGGKFLARGFGNPSSLIAFRALSRNPDEVEPWSLEALRSKLESAALLRQSLGYSQYSYRLVFGEADGLPGLIIDRFVLEAQQPGQVFVIQAHSAGGDRMIPQLVEALETLTAGKRAGIVVRNDVGVRKLEGLEEQEPRVLREVPGIDLSRCRIRVRPAWGTDPTIFEVDLVNGQKTGFFLDQTANVALWANLWKPELRKIRILDLCCYVGQWGAQLTRAYRAQGIEVELTGVDASETALELARKNVEAQGARFTAMKGDILTDLTGLADRSFDLVIVDPPALIKGRKAIPAGTHAYLQVNTQAFRLVAERGAVVSCSCSALLEEESLLQQLSKAAYRNRRQVRWVARGGQAPDHPVLAEFGEGRYLKAFMGVVS